MMANHNDVQTPNYVNNNPKQRGIKRTGVFTLVTAIFVFICLVLVHTANYIFLARYNWGNYAAGGTGLGSTGYSAQNPIFQNGITEFISLGFILLPVVLLMVLNCGRKLYMRPSSQYPVDYNNNRAALSTSVVALVFAVVNVVTITFQAIGILIVMVLNDVEPNKAGSFCKASDADGNQYTGRFCSGQELLVAAILLLLISQVMVLILSVVAVKKCKRNLIAPILPVTSTTAFDQQNMYSKHNQQPVGVIAPSM